MIKALLSDFSRVLLFPVDEADKGGLNERYQKLESQGRYDFGQYFRFNHELLDFYQTIGAQIDLYIFTSEFIQQHPAVEAEMKNVFKHIFSAADLGVSKKDPQAYKIIIEKIGLSPAEILYLDDNKVNFDAAKEAGLAVILYESNEQARADIVQALKK
jgi:HAD superfamily hydrolase (TIGR01549 family)